MQGSGIRSTCPETWQRPELMLCSGREVQCRAISVPVLNSSTVVTLMLCSRREVQGSGLRRSPLLSPAAVKTSQQLDSHVNQEQQALIAVAMNSTIR